MNIRFFRMAFVAFVLLALGSCIYGSAAFAQPAANIITVNIATDGEVGDTYCSFIEAVTVANFGADNYPTDCAAGGSDNLIQFQGVTDVTPTLEVILSSRIRIDGGSTGVAIHAPANRRVLFISAGAEISLENLVITGGEPQSGELTDRFGGGFFVLNANLYTNNVILRENSSCNGGGIYARGAERRFGFGLCV